MFFHRLSSSLQALQNSFPPLETVKHSSGNSFTLCLGITDFGSLDPCPLDVFFPVGGSGGCRNFERGVRQVGRHIHVAVRRAVKQ